MPLTMRSLVQVLSVAVLLGWAAGAHAAGDAVRGKRLAYTCLGCHGIDDYKNVYPTYSVPRLVGQHPEYLIAALKSYKNKERAHGTMYAQAASLSDQDMQDIAVYLAGTPLAVTTSNIGTAPAKVSELCVACHGKDGVGITPDYPSLGGQHADYTARALEEYKNGSRKNAIMPAFVSTLTASDIKQIADYYAQQKPELKTVLRRSWWFQAD